jgi:hypothetical protein
VSIKSDAEACNFAGNGFPGTFLNGESKFSNVLILAAIFLYFALGNGGPISPATKTYP